MNGEVDPSCQHGLVYLAGEQRLAANVGQRTVEDGVAGGPDDLDREPAIIRASAAGLQQQGPYFVGLRQGERAAPGSDLDRQSMHRIFLRDEWS